MYQLVEHIDSKIRYMTLISLSPLLEDYYPSQAKEVYLKMLGDDDEYIRKTAKRLLDNSSR